MESSSYRSTIFSHLRETRKARALLPFFPVSFIIGHIAAPTTTRKEAATDARLGQVLRVLAQHATVIASGARIAEEIGVSRSAVWRMVQKLREMGVDIAGHPRTGYRLQKMPDLLLPEVLSPLLRGTMFAENIHHYFKITSTNAAAMQAASGDGARSQAKPAPEGSVFVAEEQTAGHGRAGSSWHSEKSAGLYISMVLRPHLAPADVLWLSLIAGLAAHAAVLSTTGVSADLRWPNDLLAGGKKFCGILTELNAEVTRVRYAVVGIGINVNQLTFPAELDSIATSLRRETGRVHSRVDLAGALLKSFDREYRSLVGPAQTAGGTVFSARTAAIIRRFEEVSSYGRGKKVRVDEDGGFEGVTEGLDERGFLRVMTTGGMRTVLSGGVRELHSVE